MADVLASLAALNDRAAGARLQLHANLVVAAEHLAAAIRAIESGEAAPEGVAVELAAFGEWQGHAAPVLETWMGAVGAMRRIASVPPPVNDTGATIEGDVEGVSVAGADVGLELQASQGLPEEYGDAIPAAPFPWRRESTRGERLEVLAREVARAAFAQSAALAHYGTVLDKEAPTLGEALERAFGPHTVALMDAANAANMTLNDKLAEMSEVAACSGSA